MIQVVLLGDSLSGKTTLFDTLIYGTWHESFCTTITPSFGKYLDKYILYDTPGTERWAHFSNPYIEVADAAIIVYDVEEGDDSVNKWKQILFNKNGKEIPVLVIANKIDLTTVGKKENVLYISCKNEKNVRGKLQPFFDTLENNPKISIGWVEYVYLLLPKVEDVIDQIPGCYQQ